VYALDHMRMYLHRFHMAPSCSRRTGWAAQQRAPHQLSCLRSEMRGITFW